MSIPNANRSLASRNRKPPLLEFDLAGQWGGFSDPRLTPQGGLQIPADFTRDFHLQIGRNTFKVSRIPLGSSDDSDLPESYADTSNLYTIRNVTTSAIYKRRVGTFLDDGPTNGRRPAIDPASLGITEVSPGKSFVIGRDTAPELELDHTARRRHLLMHIVNSKAAEEGGLWLYDLGGVEAKTTVFASGYDVIGQTARRSISANSCWTRRRRH